MRRGASRSRSPEPEERASGSNDAIRLLRRGASRSRSETPPDKKEKIQVILMTTEVIIKKSNTNVKNMMQLSMIIKRFPSVLLGIVILPNTRMRIAKKSYIARHKPNQNWKDHTTAGFYAKNILWNKPTIEASIRDANARVLRVTNRKFPNLNIKLKKN